LERAFPIVILSEAKNLAFQKSRYGFFVVERICPVVIRAGATDWIR